MKSKIITSIVLLFVAGIQINQLFAQSKNDKKVKLKKVEYEMVVDATPEKAWEVLSMYGDVAGFHSQLESSKSLNGSSTKASLGCDRECVIPNGKNKIVVKEKIYDYVEGQYYTYDVYEWTNFPLHTMHNTFGVKTNAEGKTIIYQVTDYRLKPAFLSGMMKGKLRKSARASLIGYKHFIETGEKNADPKELLAKYKGV